MKPVTVFQTTLVIPDEDLLDALAAFNLPIPSKVKVPGSPEIPEQLNPNLGPLIPETIPATEDELYTEEEHLRLVREALREYKKYSEVKVYVDPLIDYLAKKKDKETREKLNDLAREALSVDFNTIINP